MTDHQRPEALRAQFERRMNLRGWSEANMRRDGLDYSSTQITEAWHAFQAGHAAAKAETADVGEPAAWMAVLTHPRSQGPQAHFVSDARLASQWKYNGVVDGEPCIVQPLFTAPQLAAAVAQERERCIGIIESHRTPVGNSAAGEMACEWTYDALKTIRAAIRAGAKEPSDG